MSGPWTSLSAKARRHRRFFFSPHTEHLEDRTLLSVSAPAEFSTLTHDDPDTPDDPFFDELWGMEKIEAERAWDVTTGSSTIVVAGIDTGIDYTHPDLYLNIWINQDEIPESRRGNLTDVDDDGLITFWDLNDPGNQGPGMIDDLNANGFIDGGDLLVPMVHVAGLDTGLGGWADVTDGDGNGYIDDLIGWNFVDDTNDPMDRNFHGTHTAGTMGAIGDNDHGVVGVNWKVQMMPLKFITEAGIGFTFDAIPAIEYAAENGAHVSNNSWGGCCGENDESDPLYQVIKEAGEQHGHLFVAAAGNSSANNDNPSQASYPASYDLPNIISVAATDRNDDLAWFSNFGRTTVDLGAPGVEILSTFTTFGTSQDLFYLFASGTSMAAPHVAGAAALVWSVDPGLTHLDVKELILRNVDQVDSLEGITVTGGRLNVAAAVQDAADGQTGDDGDGTGDGGGPGNGGGRRGNGGGPRNGDRPGDGGGPPDGRGRPDNPGEGRGRGNGRGGPPGRGPGRGGGGFRPHAVESTPRIEPAGRAVSAASEIFVGLSDAVPTRPAADTDQIARPADKGSAVVLMSPIGPSSDLLFATTDEPDGDLEGDSSLSEDPIDTYFGLFGKGRVELSSGLPDFRANELRDPFVAV